MGNTLNRIAGSASAYSDAPMQDESRGKTLSAPRVEEIARKRNFLSPQVDNGDQIDGHGNSFEQACDSHSQSPASCEACSVQAEKYQLLLNEKQLIEQMLRYEREECCKNARAVKELEHYIRSLNMRFTNEMRAREAEVIKYQQKCNVLHSQIETLENLHSQNAIADSGSYQDSSATPPLLQTAVDAVTDAMVICASDFFSTLRKHRNANLLQHDSSIKQRRPSVEKAALQAVLCKIFFKGFENLYFSLRDDHIPWFQTLSERKRELFLAFKRCRDSEAGQLFKEDEEFRIFVNAKEHKTNQEMSKHLLAIHENKLHAGSESLLNLIQNRKFLRVAKAVWALHKLAMAFQPSAEMFRVGQGSPFNGVYMEDTANDEGDAEDCGSEGEKRVAAMCGPGFLVRQTVIKCKVFCLPNTQQAEVCSPSLDCSTPMIIEDELP